MRKEEGFTVIELVIFIVILVVLAVFFILQKIDLEATYDDQQRKTSINAMYYSLTEIYHPAHGYYPSEINEDSFKAVDPELLFDPFGIAIFEPDSEFSYQGLGCDGEGKCQQFRLSARLEKEDDYVKEP